MSNGSVIIFCDVGEEIDDEIALYFFFKHYVQKYSKVSIVFTNGVRGSMASAERKTKFYEWFPASAVPANVTLLHVGELGVLHGNTYDKMLQIATLSGVGTELFENITISKRYLMGSLSQPTTAINRSKSWGGSEGPEQTEMMAQDGLLAGVPTVEISTGLARKVPFTASIVGNLREDFKQLVMDKAYDQFIGRIPPHLPFCVGVTLGANVPTIKAYIKGNLQPQFAAYVASLSDEMPEMRARVASFVNKTNAAGDGVGKMKKGMMDIYKVVRFMTDGGDYNDDSFSKKAFNGNKQAWKDKVKANNCSLTPAYDLLAMFAMETNKQQADLEEVNAAALTAEMNSIFGIPTGSGAAAAAAAPPPSPTTTGGGGGGGGGGASSLLFTGTMDQATVLRTYNGIIAAGGVSKTNLQSLYRDARASRVGEEQAKRQALDKLMGRKTWGGGHKRTKRRRKRRRRRRRTKRGGRRKRRSRRKRRTRRRRRTRRNR